MDVPVYAGASLVLSYQFSAQIRDLVFYFKHINQFWLFAVLYTAGYKIVLV